MEYVALILLAIFAVLFVVKFALNLFTDIWAKIGLALTTVAVTLVVGPGAYAADKAFAAMTQLQPNSDERKIDRLRETVRRDIVQRAEMFQTYPNETLLAKRLATR